MAGSARGGSARAPFFATIACVFRADLNRILFAARNVCSIRPERGLSRRLPGDFVPGAAVMLSP